MAFDDVGGCAFQRRGLGRAERGWGRQHKNFKAKGWSTVERHDVRIGRILDRKPPVEEFVGLQIGPGQLTLSIVLFRKEASGTKSSQQS
jgi:hypothetical protein